MTTAKEGLLIKSLHSKRWLVPILLQMIMVPFFLALVNLWTPDQGVFFEFKDQFLLAMLPGIFRRYQIGIVLGAAFLCAFFFLRRQELQDKKLLDQILIASGLSFFFYLLILTRLMQYPVACDDAYHDYRYVYNWVNGISLDYNPGERVMGFTSHLNLVVLAFASFLFNHQNIVVVAQILATVWQAASYFLIFLLLRSAYKNESLALLAAGDLCHQYLHDF